jgi:hypothetical protein
MHCENSDGERLIAGIIRREDSNQTQEVGCELNKLAWDRPCGLVVRVPGYRSRGPGSIPGTTRFFSEK